MIVHFESMSRNLNLFGKLSTLAIGVGEDLVRRQLDHTQALVERGARQWRQACTQASGAQTPEQWPQLWQVALQGTVEAAREVMAATAEHQAETLRALQENFVKTQSVLAGALEDYAADGERTGGREKRAARAPLQQRAA